MTVWPNRVPPDIESELAAILEWKARPSPQDIWTAVVEVMREKGVEAPRFSDRPELRGDVDQ